MGCHSSKTPAKALIPLHSSISFDSLKQVIAYFLEKNKEVVHIILDSKKEIKKNPELLLLVKDYFDKGVHNLDFYTALDNCLKNVKNSQLFLQCALLHLNKSDPTNKNEKVLLKVFVNLFVEEFREVLQLVHQPQLSMLETLCLKKKRLGKKLKSLKAWKKQLFIIFASASTVLLISSIVSAIVVAPPIATAIFTACSAMGGLFNSMWNKYMKAIKREKMILSALKAGASAAINEMDGIQAMVNMLRDQVSSLFENVEFNFSDEAVRFLIEEIGKKMELFMNNMEDLVLQADQCRQDIQGVVFEKLVNTPTDVEAGE